MRLTRSDIARAAFAAGGPGTVFDPLRVQLLLFLIDRGTADRIGGPFYEFVPHHYGPFDATIDGELVRLETQGDLLIDRSAHCHRCVLTDDGRAKGEAVLARIDPPVADYFERVARWVRLVPYRHMLAAIGRECPDMAVNCVARSPKPKSPRARRDSFWAGMASAFDLMGTLEPVEEPEADPATVGEGIGAAWRDVGECLEDAMVQFGDSAELW